MLRFDDELELETHELGRSLLFMLRSDEADLYRAQSPVSRITHDNPFDAVRERLAAATSAIRNLQDQVLRELACLCILALPMVLDANSLFRIQSLPCGNIPQSDERILLSVTSISNTKGSACFLKANNIATGFNIHWRHCGIHKLCFIHI